ncbi:hypothetical protein RSAG8_12483, partial [Rhizoctonia solani AG-8 WAC10335]
MLPIASSVPSTALFTSADALSLTRTPLHVPRPVIKPTSVSLRLCLLHYPDLLCQRVPVPIRSES